MKNVMVLLNILLIIAAINSVGWAEDGEIELNVTKSTQLVIDEARKVNAQENKEDVKNELAQQWERSLEAYKKDRVKLSRNESVKRWLSLYDEMWRVPKSSGIYDGYGDLQDFRLQKIISAIPDSKAWEALIKEGKKRKGEAYTDLILKYILAFIGQDREDLIAVLKQMEKGADSFSEKEKFMLQDQLIQMMELIREVNSSTDEKFSYFLNEVNDPRYKSYDLELIDLVSIVGKSKAEKVLKDLLTQTERTLTIDKGVETIALARRVALENIDQLKKAQWNLTHSVEALDLYEALDKKFNKKPKNDKNSADLESELMLDVSQKRYSYEQRMAQESKLLAKVYYMIALILNDRQEEAQVIAKEIGANVDVNLNYKITSTLQEMGHNQEIYKFLSQLIEENVSSQMWEYYIPVAIHAGQSQSLIEQLKRALESQSIDTVLKAQLTEYLYSTYLSVGLNKEAEKLISSVVVDPEKILSKGRRSEYLQAIADMAYSKIKVGHLLGNKKWVKEGIKLYKVCLDLKPKGQSTWEGYKVSALTLGSLYIDMGQYAEAEELLNGYIVENLKGSQSISPYNNFISDAAQMLLNIYHVQSRFDDVIALTKQFPYFDSGDLRDLEKCIQCDFLPTYIVANALNKKGKTKTALDIAKHIIITDPGHDLSYELILNILSDQEVLEYLDKQYSRDRFEERPLIFKAEILLKQEKIDQALLTIEQAIAIDPSDGEQGKGKRMRAYKVMADIMKAQGNDEKTKFYMNIVDAIRQSEEADEYYESGMITHAIELYEKSLEIFEDAYCIQSRMAVKLEAMGKYKEAEKYFKRAYELMPDSFGRQESHCFGCELVFAGERRQSIAEKVFLKILKEDPDNAKGHYLMGYLRMEQGRVGEARDLFRKATALDPLYVNAWKKRKEVMDSIIVSAEERDEIMLNILKLDPLDGVMDEELYLVWDIKRLWEILEEIAGLFPEPSEELYSLESAEERIEKTGNPYFYGYRQDKHVITDEIFSKHAIFQSLYPFENFISK